jgi:hypothetical protein
MSSKSVNVGRRASRRVTATTVVRGSVASASGNIVTTQDSLVAATAGPGSPLLTSDLHTVDEDVTVRPFSRRLNSVEEFYTIVADCLQYET